MCEETRKVIQTVDWECEIKTLFRDKNLGCGIAVSSAISWFFEQVEYGIILEDDCLPDISFFHFSKELLHKFKDEESLMLISGNNFLNDRYKPHCSYYFSQYPLIWGWASWKRAWSKYDYEMSNYNFFVENQLNRVFQTACQRKYFKSKLNKVIQGNINTWDYQWHYSILKNGGMCITPSVNMVENIGLQNNSTHIFLKDSFKIPSVCSMEFPLIHSERVIDYYADKLTYDNVFGYNIHRIIRLLMQNGVVGVFKYLYNAFN